jgi:hypothetical protein
MNLIRGLQKENIEALAELWEDKNFQKLVEILRLNQQNFATMCLTRAKWESVQELQWYASAFSMVIKTVQDAHEKVNNIKPRRKK